MNLSYSGAGLSKSSQDRLLINEETKEQIAPKNGGASRVSSNSLGDANRNNEFRDLRQRVVRAPYHAPENNNLGTEQHIENESVNRENALPHMNRPPTSYKP